MLMPLKNSSESGGYRYNFQGQESDDEIKGEGNSVNYKYRMHDPRVGRFFAVDPLASDYPHYTPYQFSGNQLIHAVELEGLEERVLFSNSGGVKKVFGPWSKEVAQGMANNSSNTVNTKTVQNVKADYSVPKGVKIPQMKAVSKGQMEINEANLAKQERMKLIEGTVLNDFAKIGQGLTYGPEAAATVLLPEIAGAKVGAFLFKSGSFLRKVNFSERTMNAGLNYYSQTVTQFGDANFKTKDQVGLAVNFLSPVKIKFSTELLVNTASSQVSYSFEERLSGAWDKSTSQNILNLCSSSLATGMNKEGLLGNPWANKGLTATLQGLLGVPANIDTRKNKDSNEQK